MFMGLAEPSPWARWSRLCGWRGRPRSPGAMGSAEPPSVGRSFRNVGIPSLRWCANHTVLRWDSEVPEALVGALAGIANRAPPPPSSRSSCSAASSGGLRMVHRRTDGDAQQRCVEYPSLRAWLGRVLRGLPPALGGVVHQCGLASPRDPERASRGNVLRLRLDHPRPVAPWIRAGTSKARTARRAGEQKTITARLKQLALRHSKCRVALVGLA